MCSPTKEDGRPSQRISQRNRSKLPSTAALELARLRREKASARLTGCSGSGGAAAAPYAAAQHTQRGAPVEASPVSSSGASAATPLDAPTLWRLDAAAEISLLDDSSDEDSLAVQPRGPSSAGPVRRATASFAA